MRGGDQRLPNADRQLGLSDEARTRIPRRRHDAMARPPCGGAKKVRHVTNVAAPPPYQPKRYDSMRNLIVPGCRPNPFPVWAGGTEG